MIRPTTLGRSPELGGGGGASSGYDLFVAPRLSIEAYGLQLARAASQRSEDQHHKVGCALFRPDRTVAALGYNGAPPGVVIDWTDRDFRRGYVVHAEQNALRFVHPGEVAFIASTMMPCMTCMLVIASYGVKRVVYADGLDPQVYDTVATKQLAAKCGIKLEQI